MRISLFSALRPTPGAAAAVACQPYDTVETAEAAALAEGNPDSFLRVVRPEINLPGESPTSDAVYAAAAERLQELQRRGVLVREAAPSLYVYRQEAADHAQHGVAACCHVDEYLDGTIRRHENTRPDKELDRVKHMRATSSHAEPVLLACRDSERVSGLVRETEAEEPLFDFRSGDGVRQTLWRARRGEQFVRAFAAIPACYIADGHHRAKAASVVAGEPAGGGGNDGRRWFPAVLFQAGDLRIQPYNRCVRDLAGMSARAFLAAAGRALRVSPGAAARPPGPGQVAMYVAGAWYGLSWPEAAAGDAVAALDVSVLQDRLLGPVLRIEDPRTDPRISFVGGVKGTEELARRVDAGEAAVAFSLHPVSVRGVMAVADTGRIMPPKSTWFEPKLKSGLFVHTF